MPPWLRWRCLNSSNYLLHFPKAHANYPENNVLEAADIRVKQYNIASQSVTFDFQGLGSAFIYELAHKPDQGNTFASNYFTAYFYNHFSRVRGADQCHRPVYME